MGISREGRRTDGDRVDRRLAESPDQYVDRVVGAAGDDQLFGTDAVECGHGGGEAGRLRLLAVAAGTRDPTLPSTPTISEEGLPGFEVVGWFGLLAPAATPAPILRKLHGEVVRIVAMRSVKASYLAAGLESASSSSPAEFGEFIRKEREKWAKVIKAANIRIE